MLKSKYFELDQSKRPFSTTSRLFWETVNYILYILSGIKWLFLHIPNLFREEHRHCSYTGPTTSGTNAKRACKRQRWKAARACLIHIPGLSVTAYIFFLNFSETYWENAGTPKQNIRLNALQFAAKVLEMLIAASLSLVAANYIQYEILFGKGLPFGGVIAGFQVTALSSVFSLNLWRKLFINGLRTRRFMFIFLLIVLVLLCAVVGPSCAILLQPSADWWSFRWQGLVSTWRHDPDLRWFIPGAESRVWPTHITTENFLPSSNCSLLGSSLPAHCPGGGLLAIRDSTTYGDLTDSSEQSTINTTMRIGSYIRNIDSRYCDDFRGDYRYKVALSGSTTPFVVNNVLAKATTPGSQLYSYANEKYRFETRSFIPVVSTFCTQNTVPVAGDYTAEYKNPDTVFDSPLVFPGGPSVGAEAYKRLLETSQNASFWLSPRDVGGFVMAPSITAVFFTKSYNISGQRTTFAASVACSLYASWEPATIYRDQATRSFYSPDIHGLVSEPFAEYCKSYPLLNGTFNGRSRSAQGKPILIDVNWANRVLPQKQIIDILGQKFKDDYERLDSNWVVASPSFVFVSSISLLMTDALSRIGMDSDYTILGDSPEVPNTEIVVTGSRFGYSFSARGTTRRLAIGILLTYVTITLIHTFVILWHSWSCTDLGSLYDLINLAVSSSKDLPEDVVSLGLAELKKRNVNVKAEERLDTELKMVLENLSGREATEDWEGLARRGRKVRENVSVELHSRGESESRLYSEVPLGEH